VLLLPGAVAAQPADEERFRLSVGGFFVDFDTETQVGSSQGSGTEIDLENDLGMDSSQTELVAAARLRLARRHSLGVTYLGIERDGRVDSTFDIEFGEETFALGLEIESIFDFEVLGLAYRYAFVRTPKVDLGFSLGISAIDYDLGLRAETASGTGVIEEREQEQYPVPLAGLGVVYRFAPRWAIRVGASYFEYSEDEWEGSMLITDVDVEYHPWRHFGLAVGYNFLDIDYDEEGDDPLNVQFDYDGILARAILKF
jgi:hypothetical protein